MLVHGAALFIVLVVEINFQILILLIKMNNDGETEVKVMKNQFYKEYNTLKL